MSSASFVGHLSRRRLLAGAVGLAALPILQACSSAASPSPTTAASAASSSAKSTAGSSAAPTTAPAAQTSSSGGKEIKISMWVEEAPFVVFWKNRAKAFAQKNSSTKFTWDILDVPFTQLSSKLIGMATTQQGAPNLVATEYRWFPTLLKQDKVVRVLVDLLPFMKQDKIDPNQFVKNELYSWKGKLYGLETNAVVSAYFFRNDIMKKAGMPVSYEVGGKVPWDTYDDFITFGKELKKNGGHYLKAVDTGSVWWSWQLPALQNGGQLFDSNGQLALDSEQNAACFNLTKKMLDQGVAKPLTDNETGTTLMAENKNGTVVGATQPDWYEENIIEPNNKNTSGKWLAVPLPAYTSNGNRSTVWGGTGIGITTQSQNRDTAWEFLSYGYCTLDGQVERYLLVDYFPTYKPAWKDPRVLGVTNKFYGGEKIGTLYANLAPGLPPFNTNPWLNEAAAKLLSEAWTPVMTGKKTISQGLKDAQSAAAAVIKAGV